MKLYLNSKVILKENLKLVIIEKKIDEKYLVYFYDEKNSNKLSYRLITEHDILTNEEYDKIKERHNKIRKIFK